MSSFQEFIENGGDGTEWPFTYECGCCSCCGCDCEVEDDEDVAIL